jgi:hypothetical protein
VSKYKVTRHQCDRCGEDKIEPVFVEIEGIQLFTGDYCKPCTIELMRMLEGNAKDIISSMESEVENSYEGAIDKFMRANTKRAIDSRNQEEYAEASAYMDGAIETLKIVGKYKSE